MTLTGSASACGAGTIVNAIASWKGSAFAIELRTHANVELSPDMETVQCDIDGGGDTRLMECCVALVLDKFDQKELGGYVKTTGDVPMARGLKSSSAAANAVVLAAVDALGEQISPLDAVGIGVQAALDVGVSITGAFDDACASMLGGVVVTDNKDRKLLSRVERECEVLVFVPADQRFTADVNVDGCRLMAPYVDIAFDLALKGDFEEAMLLNGLIYCAALGFDPGVMISALENGALGSGLSGTGPAFTALVDESCMDAVADAWSGFEGEVIRTRVDNTGATAESLKVD